MAKYRKKPVVIEAVRWDGNLRSLLVFEGLDGSRDFTLVDGGPKLAITTLEGTMTAAIGDWIIRGVKGELYPCRADIFEATYEPANQEP